MLTDTDEVSTIKRSWRSTAGDTQRMWFRPSVMSSKACAKKSIKTRLLRARNSVPGGSPCFFVCSFFLVWGLGQKQTPTDCGATRQSVCGRVVCAAEKDVPFGCPR
jgi:hypothetical protein